MLQLIERPFVDGRQPARGRAQVERFVVDTCSNRPDLFEGCVALENEVWGDLAYLDFTPAHDAHYETLLRYFADYHLCMTEAETGELVATGMCVPLSLPDDVTLSADGWDWVVQTASEQKGKLANIVGALSISVPEHQRHRGLARDLIKAMRAIAERGLCSAVIAPVRPSEKRRHPFVPMADYISWKDDRGRNFDPWLRSHISAGGQIMNVCDRSMVVEKPLEFWREFTKSTLDEDGYVSITGGLSPLRVDVQANLGVYVEPNVWVRHAV